MQLIKFKKPITLAILFFLPVTFLLFLYPSTHNYNPLEVVSENVKELSISKDIKLEDHLTILAFFGKNPMDKIIPASNLKELIYDKFKGFKKFQIIVISPIDAKAKNEELRKEIGKYEELKFWHFAYQSELEIKTLFESLTSDISLDANLATDEVFIVDKDLNQRGRLDDRTDNEIKRNDKVYLLGSYNCIEVAELKDKLSEDLRILFTEYRQKRKGNFDSTSRREQDLRTNEEN